MEVGCRGARRGVDAGMSIGQLRGSVCGSELAARRLVSAQWLPGWPRDLHSASNRHMHSAGDRRF